MAKRHHAEGDSLEVRLTCVQAYLSQSPALHLAGVSSLGLFLWLGNGNGVRAKTDRDGSSRLMLHMPFVLVVSHCLK